MIFSLLVRIDRLVAFVPEQRIPEELSGNFLYQTIAVLALIGLVLGAILAYAAKKFAVDENPLIEKVEDVLPKGQCGACGYAGCKAYAEAVATKEEVPANLCLPGGEKTMVQVARLTNKTVEETVKVVPVLRCTEDSERGAPDRYLYHGLQDCLAASLLLHGPTLCRYGCLGLGNCLRACPYGAIEMKKGRPSVDKALCAGCGLCVKSCPRGCLEMAPGGLLVHCACNNPGKGAPLKKMCLSACIGCGLCAKNCPHGVITMKNNLPVIEHGSCPAECPMPCCEKCPTGALTPCRR